MGLTVTEDTPADMLAGNMELLVQLPPRIDDDYDNDDIYDEDPDDHRHQHLRNHHRHHNHHHNNGHHPRRTANGNARRVTVARSTPMMDLLVQVATSQKLSASSYTLEAIGEHGLVLTHHPNTPIGALDALQVKLLPKQGTFVPTKTRHVNQPFESTFRLQVHLPRNQLYVSRVSSRMNLGKILDEVCREKNLDRNNYELCHPANIKETLDLSLSLQDYHLQEVTLCPKRRSLGSSLSSQDIMALQRQEERRRQEAKQSVFGFAFKKSKESSLSTDSLGERSVSPARSDGTGRSASPQAPTAPTRPQRKRRPAPKPPIPRAESEPKPDANRVKETGREAETEKVRERESAERIIISHSRNSSDSSGYHEASVLSDNLDSNIRVPETLPRRGRLPAQESPPRTLAQSSQASKSLGNLAAVPAPRTNIARGTSNSSLASAGLRKKRAPPAPPQPRPLTSATSTQALERIVDSEESLTSSPESLTMKASSDVAVPSKRNVPIVPRMTLPQYDEERHSETPKLEIEEEKNVEKMESVVDSPHSEIDHVASSTDPSISSPKNAEIAIIPNLEPASEHKRGPVPVPKPRGAIGRLESVASSAPPKVLITQRAKRDYPTLPKPRDLVQHSMSSLDHLESIPSLNGLERNVEVEESRPGAGEEPNKYSVKLNDDIAESPRPIPRSKLTKRLDHRSKNSDENEVKLAVVIEPPKKPRRKTLESPEPDIEVKEEADGKCTSQENGKNEEPLSDDAIAEEITAANTKQKVLPKKRKQNGVSKISPEPSKASVVPRNQVKRRDENHSVESKRSAISISANIADGSRSCTVISTIPKCDHFERPEDDTVIRKRPVDGGSQYNTLTKMDSLGVSFGAGKSILDSNYQLQDLESNGTLSTRGDMANSSNEDELELESFEMFEQSQNLPKLSTLLRSHSELNNFEINTFQDHGRHITSRSVDFTFALNPNLSRNISDLSTDSYPQKYLKRHVSLEDPTSSKKSPQQFPAFREYLQGAEDDDTERTTWIFGEPGLGDDSSAVAAVPIAKTEQTSNLLKKVSDTLSESLRSPEVAASSSLANEQESLLPTSKILGLDERGPADTRPGVNGPQPIFEVQEKSMSTKTVRKNEAESNSLTDSEPPSIRHSQDKTNFDYSQNNNSEEQFSSASTDWEYLLPEPPTAFRDTNVDVNDETTSVPKAKTLAKIEQVAKSREKTASVLPEIPKSTGIAIPATNSGTLDSGIRLDDEGRRSRTVSATSSEIGSELTIERGRSARPIIKSGVDSESRRGSQASSTPAVAPVDNTLSNFVITTYSKPKNVDIFGEIEGRVREPHLIISRKNSAANSGVASVFVESRKSSTASNKEVQARFSADEKSREVVAEARPEERPAQAEILPKVNEKEAKISSKSETQEGDNESCNNLSRSNIKISIVTKPRPRADSIAENKRSKTFIASNGQNDFRNSSEEIDAREENSRESVTAGNNHKFSQWRENILKKQETPTKEKQLQSLQVLRSILPQLDNPQQNSDDPNMTDKTNSNNSSEEIMRVVVPVSNNDDIPTEPIPKQVPTAPPTSDEPRVKVYTYAGPPAIDLGSWSDRSRTTRVQIKPDNDYKFDKSRTPEAGAQETPSLNKEKDNVVVKTVSPAATVILGNAKPDHSAFKVPNAPLTASKNLRIISMQSEKESLVDNQDKKEPSELAKTLIARTTASGFKRPVEPSGTMMWRKKEDPVAQKLNDARVEPQGKLGNGVTISAGNHRDEASVKEAEKEVDTRPLNFKELKEAFAKEQNTNSLSKVPKYGSYVRRTDSSNNRCPVRRDSSLSSNGTDPENVVPSSNNHTLRKDQQVTENARINKPVVSVQEKRNFVIPATNKRTSFQETVSSAARRTSFGTVMPVVKGFKLPTEEEVPAISQEKRTGYRVAIGDISNGNYVASHNGLRKTVSVKVEDISSGVPKPPPTMPVITGVTLKSTNYTNARPKSIAIEPDTRNQLLESIRNFGGQNQLRHASRRNNINGALESRFVRS